MKRLFILLCLATTLVSCGEANRDFYFDDVNSHRVYNDSNAEFDTLSYAVGMNMGLSMVMHPAGNIFDVDAVVAAFNEEISKSIVDKEFIKANTEYLTRFNDERLRQYIFSKRLAMIKKGDEVDLPVLFDEDEFTAEKVSQCYGYDMANHVRKNYYPVNIHWFMQAMEDAKAVEEMSIVDNYMAISSMEFTKTMRRYVTEEFPAYMAERSSKWLEMVSKQENVNAITVDGETLYYRVDKAGNGVKPRGLKDTVSFSYNVYTQRGELVESLEERVVAIREALDKALADTTTTNKEMQMKRVDALQKQLEQNENLSVVLDRAMIKGSQYGMQKVGEGGDITLWIPASLAYGAKGNKMVSPNEGIVMTIHLKSVSYGPTAEELETKKMLKKGAGIAINPNGMSENVVMPKQPKTLHKSNESGKGVAAPMIKITTPNEKK